jgi:predicted  nucleic acid-binding Zn-ribbon protein
MRTTSFRAMGLGMLALAGITLGTVGCSHSPHAQSVKLQGDAVGSLDTMRTDLAQIDQQVQATQASLHDLANQQVGDLKPTFNNYSSNVDKAASMSDKLNSRTNSISNASYEYLNNWNVMARDIRDQQLQSDSLSRQQQSRQQYEQVVNNVSDLQGEYSQYLHRLQDARAFIASDLTYNGVQKLKGQIPAIDSAAQALRQKLANTDARVGQLASSWQSATPIPAPGDNVQAVPAGGRMQPPPSDQSSMPGSRNNMMPSDSSEKSTSNQPQSVQPMTTQP